MHITCKKLTGPIQSYSTPSLSSPGQEDWSLCTNCCLYALAFLYVSVSMVQYIAGKINF